MPNHELPLLPLILDDVPMGLVQALAQEGVPFRHRWKGAMSGRFVLFDSRRGPCAPLGYGQDGIDVDEFREGADDDPFEALLDHRSARYQWQIASLTVAEDIARVDRRAIRKLVLRQLRRRLEAAGGIWLRISPYPYPYRSAINFRIDYDEYDPSDFDATLAAIAGHEGATSHFVSGAAYQRAPEALARLQGLDVGSHGYRHHTYRTAEENLANIGRGIEVLRAAGIEPSGFAAPHGRFHRRLLLALESLGISHSSEFGLVYDELPLFVATGNLLQIPVHPVCLGLFIEAARRGAERSSRPADALVDAAVDRAVDYFDETIRSRYHGGEPVFLYGHPTGRLGRHPRVVRAVFEAASGCSVLWKTTFTEMNRWWRARVRVRLTVTRHEGQYVLVANRAAPGYRLAIEYCRARHVALIPLAGHVIRFSPSALAYQTRGEPPSVRPVRVDRPQGLRGRVRRLIDWERVTPIEEISGGGWRNWTKRTLRRFRGG